MLDGDLLCRSVIYPKGFSEQVFSDEALIDLQDRSLGHDRKRYVASVTSSFLLKTESRAHEYGCSAAELARKRYLDAKEDEAKEGDIPHYLGFYEFHAGSLKSFRMEYYIMELKWSPELGNDEHFDLAMVLQKSLPTKKAHKDDLKMAKNRIAKALMGPKRKICDCDIELTARLNAIDLPILPYRALIPA